MPGGARPRLLHVFPSFAPGGAQVRFTQLVNRLAAEYRHTVIAINGDLSARRLLASGVDCEFAAAPGRGPAAAFAFLVRRLRPDLVQTYNWGAFDALVGALLARACPVVHTEDGFGPEEAGRLKRRRVLARRAVLPFARALAVPSRTLEQIALEQYRLKSGQVRYIPNGVDAGRFCPGDGQAMRARWGVGGEEFVAGAVGHLRGEKNLELLLRAFAGAGLERSRLVLVGGGPEEARLREAARQAGLSERVIFAGEMDPAPCYRAFDLFVMSSMTEQMPLALLEAMASGCAALCTDAGDSAAMLDSPDLPAIVPRGDEAAFAAALRAWAADAELRRRAGERNRVRCLREYTVDRMVERWRALYWECLRAR